jgi:D-alanyl-D-alanine carboxypeptidase
VASATRNGRRLIAVVLGASSGQMRAVRAAQMLERGFANNSLSWLKPSLGKVEDLVPIDTTPPNLRDEMCSGKRHKPASDEDDTVASNNSNTSASSSGGETNPMFFTAGLQPPISNPAALIAGPPDPAEPILVYTGPTRSGAALLAAEAADAEKQAARHKAKKRLAAKKPDLAESKTEAGKESKKSDAKGESKAAEKPAAKHAAAKSEAAKPAAKSTPGEPAKHKPVAAKPKATTSESKPAKSSSAETRPAG